MKAKNMRLVAEILCQELDSIAIIKFAEMYMGLYKELGETDFACVSDCILDELCEKVSR